MSVRSFSVNLLSFVLAVILIGFSFLILDRMVLHGRYTNPYNKDDVIKSLGEQLNLQIQENNALKEQLFNTQTDLENVTLKLNSLPYHQLNRILKEVLPPQAGVGVEKGRIIFREPTFFKEGSDVLSGSAKKSLDRVALQLIKLEKQTRLPWILRIEGHTDRQTAPDVNGYGSNWMISYKRAYAVGQYLINKGLDAKRLYMAGFSSYRPGPYPHNRRVSLAFDYV